MRTVESKNGKPGSERAPEEAAHYFLGLQSGDQSQEEAAQFVDWLRESPQHVSELLRTARLHRRLSGFSRWSDVKRTDVAAGEGGARPVAPVIELQRARRPRSWRSVALLPSLAAGVLVLIAGAVLFWRTGGAPMTTTSDQWRQVHLADGSVVDLAPNSAVRPAYSASTRTIYLDRGEALFEVQKNRQRPFLVVAGNTVVRAVGTAFDVNRRQRNEIAVTVVEGVVQLRAGHSPDATPLISSAQAPTQLSLHANEEVLVSSVSGAAAPIQKVNAPSEVAWATGELDFDNETVASVVGSFNRFNAKQIVVTDASIAARRVSGSFRINDPDSFVAFLANTTDVRVTPSRGRFLIDRK